MKMQELNMIKGFPRLTLITLDSCKCPKNIPKRLLPAK